MITTYIIPFAVTICATLSFAILFTAPKDQYLYCALTGGAGYLTYLILLNQFQAEPATASLFATLILTLLSRIFSVIRKNPVTVYLVAGIFPLVPGAGIYYTSYYLIMNEPELFSKSGFDTFKIAGAISLGIIFGLAVPQRFFRMLQALLPSKK
ncbi:MAG: threonine/serine exporter family protein [Lachnospiraceae bacterium]